jgi:hypothetical protein
MRGRHPTRVVVWSRCHGRRRRRNLRPGYRERPPLGVNEDVAGDGVEERGQEALVELTELAAMLGMLGLCWP